MEPAYVYVKRRAEFGKQCIFDDYGPVVDEDIQPDAVASLDHVRRNPCHGSNQKSKQYAVHEAQTSRIPAKNAGTFHYEGGWPKEINPKDEEATARFRRRTEKDEDWASKLGPLFKTAEQNIRQNNAINIHEHYFDDIVATSFIGPPSLRTVNVYIDPQLEKRSVNWISWSSDRDMKIIVSYCFMDFQKATKAQPHSYVWNIENSNVPASRLKTFSPLTVSEFHPRNSIRVASGLMTGQVCVWDLRKSKRPVGLSRLDSSHSCPVSGLKWIQSKNGCEFFSSSYDGQVMTWDMRKFQKPTSILIFDFENPNDPNLDRTYGVSCMNYDTAVTTKLLIGLENGIAISASRKSKSPEEKMALRFDCHYGPVISIDRNRSIPKCFLSIGDWTARVWSEDTKEGGLVSTRYCNKFLTGGCWSKSRHSLFYTINRTGHLKSWDLLQDLKAPVASLRLCNDRLTTMTQHEDQGIMAIGNTAGHVYLVKASEGLVRFSKDEKTNFVTYIDRCSRFVKAIDVRRKELKLARRLTISQDIKSGDNVKESILELPGKDRRKSIRERKFKDKQSTKEHELMRSKIQSDPELQSAEKEYFKIIDEELSKFNRILDEDDEFRINNSGVPKHPKDRKISANSKIPSARLRNEKRISPKRQKNIVILKKSKTADIQGIQDKSINPTEAKDQRERIISKMMPTKENPKMISSGATIPKKLKPLISPKICKVPCAIEICCKDILAKAKSNRQQNDKRDEESSRSSTRKVDPDAANEIKAWKRIPGFVAWKSSDSFTQDEKMKILRNISAPPEKMAQIFARRQSSGVAKKSDCFTQDEKMAQVLAKRQSSGVAKKSDCFTQDEKMAQVFAKRQSSGVAKKSDCFTQDEKMAQVFAKRQSSGVAKKSDCVTQDEKMAQVFAKRQASRVAKKSEPD